LEINSLASLQSLSEAAKFFVVEGDVFGLGLVEADETAAAELARLRDIMQRFPAPREGISVHMETVENKHVAHSFTVDAAGRLFIKTKVIPSSL